MGKEKVKIEGTMERSFAVDQIRLAARQFAMLYFHFVKVLYDSFGAEKAKELVRQTVFDQAVDRSDQMRKKAKEWDLPTESLESFRLVSDLPRCGWIPEWGEDHCPYAEVWREYVKEYPWFREFATFYCDVIDTTTVENFTRTLSHRITANVINGGDRCTREYFEKDEVKEGRYTYGKKD